MDESTRALIETLHKTCYRYVLAVTGGGAQAGANLLNVPGGSRTVLEVRVPYHSNALADFLGGQPEQNCSAETSRAMAVRAFERARQFAGRARIAGIGCTASLTSDRPKRGDHRFYLSIHTTSGTTTWSLTLQKDARDRGGEEELLDRVLLNALAETFGLASRLATDLLPGEQLLVENRPDSATLARFLNGEFPALLIELDGRMRQDAPPPSCLVCGSFNPLHSGHLRLAEVAGRILGVPPAFELSVENVDKPRLTCETISRRAAQFNWRALLWLTCAPRFVEKAKTFRNCTFVVGHDTAERLIDPAYCGGSESKLRSLLGEIADLGGRFLVAGRIDRSGRFRTLADIAVPQQWRSLFQEIPEVEMRMDVSSTELRKSM